METEWYVNTPNCHFVVFTSHRDRDRLRERESERARERKGDRREERVERERERAKINLWISNRQFNGDWQMCYKKTHLKTVRAIAFVYGCISIKWEITDGGNKTIQTSHNVSHIPLSGIRHNRYTLSFFLFLSCILFWPFLH